MLEREITLACCWCEGSGSLSWWRGPGGLVGATTGGFVGCLGGNELVRAI